MAIAGLIRRCEVRNGVAGATAADRDRNAPNYLLSENLSRVWVNVPMTSPMAASLYPTTSVMSEVEKMVVCIRQGASEWTPERHRSFCSQPWGHAPQSDKALRHCVYENGLATAKAYRVKRRNRMEASIEAAGEVMNGYILGRGLLGTASSHPSYSKSDAEVVENAKWINERAKLWSFDTIIHALDAGDHQLARYIGTLWRHTSVTELLGDHHDDGAAFLGLYCGGVGVAMAEEYQFGPLAYEFG